MLQPWRVGVFRGRFCYWLCGEIVFTLLDLFVVYPIYCKHKFLRPPPRPHVAPLFPRGAMVRVRKFWKLTEKKKDKFLVMLRGITGTSLTSKSLIVLLASLTSKSLIVLLEYSDDFLLINVYYK